MNHPPYTPEDLKAPPLSGSAFLALLKEQKQEKYPEPPPFYQALYDGSLKREYLELWVKNMYAYWNETMVTSTGALFCKDNDEETRTHMLKKLVCIEGKGIVNDLNGWTASSYEEMWLRFGEGLGIRRDDILSWKTFMRSYFAMTTLGLLSRWWEWNWLDGIAAMYAGDLLGQECMGRAYEALKRFYRVPEGALEFFTNYLADVGEDVQWEEKALAYWPSTTERQLTAARAFRNRLDIEYQLVLPLATAIQSDKLPLQVP